MCRARSGPGKQRCAVALCHHAERRVAKCVVASMRVLLRVTALLASVAGMGVAQQGMCQQRYATCDEPRSGAPGEGGFGTGGCVAVVTDECGSTQIDVTDASGAMVFAPMSLSPGQTITTQCRKVAEMETSGLRLSEVRLDDPEIAGAIGGSDMPSWLSSIQTMEQVLSIFGALGGEVCITLEDAHITTEVTQACVIAELKVGDVALMEPIDVGCWYEGLACYNATSCSSCTRMADSLRASGRYDGAASCGWCAATSQCLLGGSGGPRCQSDGECDDRSWTLEPALCPATAGGSTSPSAAQSHAACIVQSMLTSSSGSSAIGRQSSADLVGDATTCVGVDSGNTAVVIAALIGGAVLGFLAGSCWGAGVGELMRVVGHRVFPDCIPDPYRRNASARYNKESTSAGAGGSVAARASSARFVAETAATARGDAIATPSLVPPRVGSGSAVGTTATQAADNSGDVTPGLLGRSVP